MRGGWRRAPSAIRRGAWGRRVGELRFARGVSALQGRRVSAADVLTPPSLTSGCGGEDARGDVSSVRWRRLVVDGLSERRSPCVSVAAATGAAAASPRELPRLEWRLRWPDARPVGGRPVSREDARDPDAELASLSSPCATPPQSQLVAGSWRAPCAAGSDRPRRLIAARSESRNPAPRTLYDEDGRDA